MKKKLIGSLFIMMCFIAVLGACSSNKPVEQTPTNVEKNGAGEEQATTDPTELSKEKISIKWLNLLHTATPPTNTLLDKIEEFTNVDLEFSWIPAASQVERLNTALASNSLADLVTITILDNASVRNALKAGMFWEVSSYLDEFPNLKAISDDFRTSASIEGKLYGIPFQQPVARNGVIIRKDWLDKLDLPIPKTTDELFKVAEAFTKRDPDGNNVDDTTGFVDRSDLHYGAFKTLASYFGAPSVWSVSEAGEVIPEFEHQGYIDAMDYMKKLYESGYINKDFAVTTKNDQQQSFAQGKSGIYVGMLLDGKNLSNLAEGLQDDMELVLLNDITSTGNPADRAIWSTSNGVGGLIAFPKSEVKDEAELRRVLKFVDDLMSEEMFTLMSYGVEGVHFEMDENKTATITNTDLWMQEVQPLSSTRPRQFGYGIYESDVLRAEGERLIAENTEFAVLNPMYSLESATHSSQGSELIKTVHDATYKYILGQITIEDFHQAVAKWRKSGGDKIIAEYEAAYKAIK
ncbi:extracellular solute-binding protein [Paenibacillus yanchengensis]|uniref:Extracellular solute-binding protein n=1 Tax=Paenibacillus yanchengensis TaxID=2035833 RepID=A0ABW4YR47_9BACL